MAGKAALGIKVVDAETGDPPGFGKGLLRTAGLGMNVLLTLGFGFLMMLADARRRTLHDHLAGTAVVHTGVT